MTTITQSNQMAEVLLELYVELQSRENKSEFEQSQFSKIKKVLVDVKVIMICSACENQFCKDDLIKRTNCCDIISYFCPRCVKRHDRECDKFHENLAKIKEEKESNYRDKIKVETRMSRKVADDRGMVKCSCKRYFVPEIRVTKDKEVPYKSCKVCRDKRKKPKKAQQEQPGEQVEQVGDE